MRTVIIALLLSIGFFNEPATAGFLFTKVIDLNSSSVPYNNIDFRPQINNNNQIAFQINAASGGINGGIIGASQIYRWQAGASTLITSTGSVIPGRGTINSLSGVALSDSGSVAFRTSYNVGGGSVMLASTAGLQEVFSDSNTLNVVRVNAGDRVLSSLQSSPGGTISVQSQTVGGSATTHASNDGSGTFSSYVTGGAPSPDINDAGNVALRGILRSTSQDGIYVVNGSGTQSVANVSNGFAFFGNNVDINNDGNVAFLARTTTDPAGRLSVYTGTPGQSATLIASQANFTSIADNGPAINDVGMVLFQATFNGSEAIFSGGNPLTDRVVGVGDTLDGGIVKSIFFGRGMLNNDGNIVFYSLLDSNNDGVADRTSVFFGSVTAVPEPTALGFVVCAAAGILTRRRLRAAQHRNKS